MDADQYYPNIWTLVNIIYEYKCKPYICRQWILLWGFCTGLNQSGIDHPLYKACYANMSK